jgi:hypothetical protein
VVAVIKQKADQQISKYNNRSGHQNSNYAKDAQDHGINTQIVAQAGKNTAYFATMAVFIEFLTVYSVMSGHFLAPLSPVI